MAANAANGTGTDDDALAQGGLELSALHDAADRLATLHADAPLGDAPTFRALLDTLAAGEIERRELERQRQHIARRAQGRRIRELATGGSQDILFDLARALLGLIRHGHVIEANTLANRYLDVRPQGATGWALLPLYLSLHALQREDRALADLILAPSPPRLIAIGGLSGTGKSTLARLLGARIGRAPGARVLRSDVFRKRIAGVAPETRLPPRHYNRRSDQETYEAMFESADDHLACGSSVILDAVFMSRSERDVVEALAARARVPFTGFWLEAPEQDRIARVTARTNDASDATEQVVREQSKRSVGEVHWHRMRVNRPLDTIVPAARAALERGQR